MREKLTFFNMGVKAWTLHSTRSDVLAWGRW